MEICAALGRDRRYLLGWIKRFELPPGHGIRYPATYLSFFRTVAFLRLTQIPEEKRVELWALEKKPMSLLHVDTSSSPTWIIDGHAAAGKVSRRHFLSRFDIGTDLLIAYVQPGLDFSPAPAELFGGRDMGEDALRLLGIYLVELKPVLVTVVSHSTLLGEEAPDWKADLNVYRGSVPGPPIGKSISAAPKRAGFGFGSGIRCPEVAILRSLMVRDIHLAPVPISCVSTGPGGIRAV